MDSMPPILPIIFSIIVISNIIKAGKRVSKTRTGTSSSPSFSKGTSRSQSLGQNTGKSSAQPKPWQVGKSNVTKPTFNGKTGRGKAFGQRAKTSRYDSAFEDKGLLSNVPVAAFGEARDIISKGSMAASNAEYIDVGNDYVSGFDVDGRRETPIGFDR